MTFIGDTEGAFSRLQVMGACAEFERNIIRRRHAEGIAKAKALGVYCGCKKGVADQEIIDLKQQGSGSVDCGSTGRVAFDGVSGTGDECLAV